MTKKAIIFRSTGLHGTSETCSPYQQYSFKQPSTQALILSQATLYCLDSSEPDNQALIVQHKDQFLQQPQKPLLTSVRLCTSAEINSCGTNCRTVAQVRNWSSSICLLSSCQMQCSLSAETKGPDGFLISEKCVSHIKKNNE